MPRGILHYWFVENEDVWAVSIINAFCVSGAYAFARFMYTGNIFAIFHRIIPFWFCGTLGVSVLHTKAERLAKRQRGEMGKDYVRIHKRVPMFPDQPATYKNMPPALTVEIGDKEIDLKKMFEYISLNDIKKDPRKMFDNVPEEALVKKKEKKDPAKDTSRIHNPYLKKPDTDMAARSLTNELRPVRVGNRIVVPRREQSGPSCPCDDEKKK